MDKKQKQALRLLATEACLHTAFCLLDEYLQEHETDYVYKEMQKKPPKLIQDILSARAKLHDAVDRLMPNFSSKQIDYLNQVSYVLENVCDNTFKIYTEEGTLVDKE